MENEKVTIVNLWFKKAESDFKTIENNLKSNDPPTDAICFHAQQAIEKYMKGALVYFEQHITRTHDLVNLLTSIVHFIPEQIFFTNRHLMRHKNHMKPPKRSRILLLPR